ncbi:hypothetical protein [Evansella tamaricis]|uniref:Uncharacterized protein n=1 Tax=Evansella tamaricis TaxID=2069301 RepID=A0ABS6JD77_9BACI|nr:hypothetical protein [Evansella tamaricis]MBU9711625.1 hypothetical protein [Evansella tamaricis]
MTSNTSRVYCELSQRTERPNIGQATGRGALPDGRMIYIAMLEEEKIRGARWLTRRPRIVKSISVANDCINQQFVRISH